MKRILMTAVAAVLMCGPALADGWRDQYKTVRVGVLSAENEKDRIARHEPFKNYLEKALGVKIEIYTAGSYDGVVQAMAANQIEFAFFGSSAYAAAYTETNGGVIPLLSRLENDNSTGYFSVIVTRCDSGIKSLDDLKGKVLAFADPDSTSGYAVPYFNLVKQGIEPSTYFASVPFSGAHETGVMGVVNKQYDGAATYENNDINGIPQRMVSKGMIKEGDICKIWKSPEITAGPLAGRANLPKVLLDDMTKAVMAIPEKDPEAFKLMSGGEKSTQKGWVEVSHPRYAWIVEMRDWLKKQRRKTQ